MGGITLRITKTSYHASLTTYSVFHSDASLNKQPKREELEPAQFSYEKKSGSRDIFV